MEVSRHLLPVAPVLYQFPLWLCDVLIPALAVTSVKSYREVKHLFYLYSERGESGEGLDRNSCLTVLSARIWTRLFLSARIWTK